MDRVNITSKGITASIAYKVDCLLKKIADREISEKQLEEEFRMITSFAKDARKEKLISQGTYKKTMAEMGNVLSLYYNLVVSY